jgi:signal transduction histidine kinase
MLRILQTIGLVLPVVLLLYGFLSVFGYTHSPVASEGVVLYALMTVWILFALYHVVIPSTDRTRVVTYGIIYHAFAVVYTLFIIGYESPILACWSLLYFMAYVLYSHKGFVISILFILAGWLIYTILFPANTQAMVGQLIAVATSILIGLIAVVLSQIQAGDRKKLEESKQRAQQQEETLSTVINSTTQAIITISASGKIKLYNSALLGLIDTNAVLTGVSLDSILPLVDEDKKPVSLFSLMKSGKHFERDDLSFPVYENDAIRLHINVNNIQSSYMNGAKVRDEYVCILRDITKEKSLEEERDEFISVVSHELRTPITIAEGTISNALVMLDRPDMPPETIQKGVKLAHDQVRFLANMVNDLSTLSRAERGVADTLEEISVDELAQKLYQEYAPQAKEKGLQMDLDAAQHLGSVKTSRLYLEELLQNFITNAIKYTKEGKVLLAIKKSDGKVIFAVKDSGIGISKSDQAKIFDKFYRSEDYRTRETGGTGLGLYVAAKLARKIGTKIEVKSRLNHGSVFTIELKSSQ